MQVRPHHFLLSATSHLTLSSFNPETLACTSDQDTTTCLNADQLAVLPQIYADYYENGEFVSTGFNLGGEDAYFTNFLAETPSPLVTEWLEYMVLKYAPTRYKPV